MRQFLTILITALLLTACSKSVPPPQLFNAEAEFEKANEYFEGKHWEDARRTFENIRNKDTELAPLAHLRIADSYMQEDEFETAVDEYRRFLNEYPRHKFASYAQHQIGLVYYQLINGYDRALESAKRALESFEKLMALYPRNPYRESVILKIQHCRDVIADHEYMVGNFYYKKSSYNGALGRFLNLLEDFPEYKNEKEVLYKIAVSFKGIADDALAEEYFTRLKTKYPDSDLIKKTEKEFAKIERKRKEEQPKEE